MRNKTGDKCVVTGRYRFDGYTNGSTYPPPTREEQVIPLSNGETFPPIRSSNKGAYWQLI